MHQKTITWGCEGDAGVTGEPRILERSKLWELCQGKLQTQNRTSLRERSHAAELEGQSFPRPLEFRIWLWSCGVRGRPCWVWDLLPLIFSHYPLISHFWIEMVLCAIIRNDVCILEIPKLYFGFTGFIVKRLYWVFWLWIVLGLFKTMRMFEIGWGAFCIMRWSSASEDNGGMLWFKHEVSHRLMCLNTWSPLGGSVRKDGRALLGEGHHSLGVDFEKSQPLTWLTICSLCFSLWLKT